VNSSAIFEGVRVNVFGVLEQASDRDRPVIS